MLFLMVAIWPTVSSASTESMADPLAIYGERHEFSVLRDGIPVGKHLISFQQTGEAVHVDSFFNVEVKFLGISLYRFDYQSEAIWKEGKLQTIDVKIDDDGTSMEIKGKRQPDKFIINGEAREIAHGADIYPTNHWNSGIVGQSQILNTLTGKVNNVAITKTGEETVAVRGGTVRASRYVYDGELKIISWYDRRGRWVKMEFKAKDNSDMVYFCETCPVEIGSRE